MKSLLTKAVAISSLVFAANTSFAGCATLAILGSPSIPDIADTQFEDAAALAVAMQNYVSRAETKLEECRESSDSFEFNAAIAALENKAEKYNRIARFYNRNGLAMN
ncbi:hypothetical protein IB286_09150 [Spongiibacter sp. KMU-158]|uniref:Uncharacterized protein n=1 Tax=Spongiibacter pelagi TaxID=2760804 RepID=A0A927GX89_9GAMM|nr:hypothetical protein [Spongiibacter pelagi]MBD2859174.1 hypothetical protein [Spongiibacter pelagi]